MDEKERQELLRFVAETVHECQEITGSVREFAQQRWESLAGDRLEAMMQGPSATAHYLRNADPKLREAALHISNYHWGLNRSLEPTLQRMAWEDADDDVRGIALLYLVSLYRGTDDARIGKLLVEFVKDQSLSTEFRTTAYYALFRLRGLSSEYWPHMWSAEWRFPDDVDWSFVDTFT